MASESASDVKLEIGHVLFIDIVGYSKLLIHEQSEQLEKLRTISRATEQFRAADAQGNLLRLPTGDGGALVFRTSPEEPVICALEISKALRNHPELRVRMGIHSGPVRNVTDLTSRRTLPALESTLRNASWIVPMRVTFCCRNVWPTIWNSTPVGVPSCMSWALAK